jgi:Glycoside Hydrolase Family 113
MRFDPRLACRLPMAILAMFVVAPGCSESPSGPADTGQMVVRGVTLADWSADGYSTPSALAAVDRIARTGANTMPIVITLYQAGRNDNNPSVDPQRTPSQSSISDVVLRARSRELRVSLKIHVDLDTGEWRGLIEPTDAARWFSNYELAIAPWISFADAMGIEQFVIGTELAGTVRYEQYWKELVAAVRSGYGGEVTYASSWDEARLVTFWDVLDVVGVDFYAPVATRNNAHRFEILEAWQPWLVRLQLLHKLTGRDVLLTEIGYRSIDGAGVHPYDHGRVAPTDQQEQADLYWAAMQAVGDKPWIRGVYWWNWLANGTAGEESDDFTPKDKLAEQEIIDAWRE